MMLFPVTLVPDAGEVTVTCMCSAPIGSIPPPIDMDELGIGIELDISGIGVWLAAAEGLPELPQAAAANATVATPTPALKAEPGREAPGDANLNMGRPPRCPNVNGHRKNGSKDAPYRRRRCGVDCTSSQSSDKETGRRPGPSAGAPGGCPARMAGR